MIKRVFLAMLISFTTLGLSSQELKIGGSAGVYSPFTGTSLPSIGAVMEYRPKSSIMSINFDPYFLFSTTKTLFTAPFYLKFSFGEKIVFSLAGGGFIRSNSNLGINAGLVIDFPLSDRSYLFIKGDFIKEWTKDENPRYMNIKEAYTFNSKSTWLNIGFKRNITKSTRP